MNMNFVDMGIQSDGKNLIQVWNSYSVNATKDNLEAVALRLTLPIEIQGISIIFLHSKYSGGTLLEDNFEIRYPQAQSHYVNNVIREWMNTAKENKRKVVDKQASSFVFDSIEEEFSGKRDL